MLLLVALAGNGAPAGAEAGLTAARGFVPRQVLVKFEGQRFGRAVALPAGVGVREAAAALRGSPRVAYATPDYIATASAPGRVAVASAAGPAANASADPDTTEATIPNDPGTLEPSGLPGGWVEKQWNFLPWEGPATPLLPISPGGIDAVGAWRNLEEVNRPGARGTTIAVLDTGIAYRAKGSLFRRSPDFTAGQFAKGYDFVDDDPFPLDENGHGTHVAGTIGEKTNNGIGLTGLAYGAKLIPVRVLNRNGRGRASAIARGIRFAVARGADVINMSFNFECGKEVPPINEALRMAYRKGVLTVASIGNRHSEDCVAPPSTGPRVIGVGGSTQGGCLGDYSLAGKDVDLLAPGGAESIKGCPSVLLGPIYQVTFIGSVNPRRFGEPAYYAGTSMAAAHVSGVAAMVIASGVVGKDPSPARVARRLRETARDLGVPSTRQGAGLIDAARATELVPKAAEPAARPGAARR
jgi:serine protease